MFIYYSFNETYSYIQCTYNNQYTSQLWQQYFYASTLGFNYHTVRFFLSELVPSVLVALFNIAIIICILRTTAHVRKRQEYHHNNQLSMSMITGITSKLPAVNVYDPSQQRFGSIKRCSFKTSPMPVANVPFGKMSWMNVVLILHSLLFFLSSSLTSLVYFSTSNRILAHWISVIILANCSLNFYVYCLSGRQFRTELKRIGKRYIRNLHKAILRRCYKPDNRRHSNAQTAKDHVYQPVPQQQQQADIPEANLRQYRIMDFIKR